MFTEYSKHDLDYLSLILIIFLFLCCSLAFSLSTYVVFSWENWFQLFPMVLNKKLFKLHIWYINQLTYQNTRFGTTTCIPERCGVFFSYLAVYSNTFLLLLMKAKDALKWSMYLLLSWSFDSRCLSVSCPVSWFPADNTRNFFTLDIFLVIWFLNSTKAACNC